MRFLARALLVSLTSVVLGAGSTAFAKYEGFTAVGPTGEQIVEFVRSAEREFGFSGAVLAARDGKVIAAIAVGKVGDGSEKPLAVSSLFELASCSKPFTAVAVMKLVEEGKLQLDDPISKFLPGIPDSCQAITVRHLLQHTSGIPGSNSRGAGTDLAAVLPTFLEGGPRNPPGEKHEYWNQGYALLSEVIARASGKSYMRCLRDEIFKPAGMKHTCFNGNRPPRGVLVATGKSQSGRDRSALEHPYGEYGFQYRGMGGIVTNIIDLWKWDRALAAGKLLKTESIAEMTRPGDQGYALGWRVAKLEDGSTVHEHTGSVRGFLASLRREPAHDGCLFVLANSDASMPFNRVKSGCEQILAGKEVSLQGPEPIEPALAEALLGKYRDDQDRTLTVSREGKLLRAWIDWHGPITRGYFNPGDGDKLSYDFMKPSSPSGFQRMNEIEVERGSDGSITAVTISDLEPPLRFERVAK
jgi:CubicO group peptidase (beta-lactamase class C family)